MKTKLAISLLIATLSTAAYASAPILPDSCGDPKITFDATMKKASASPTPPAEGKAQIILIMTLVKKGLASPFGMHNFTTRFGMDGSWLGASGNNSYFAVDIAPGEHHLCANVESTMSGAKNMIGMQKFTAEAGKVYYFEFTATKVSTSSQNSSDNYYSSTFAAVDEDEGKFRVKAMPVSTSVTHKPE